MNFISNNLKYIATACVAAVIGLAATAAFGQNNAGKGEHKSGERSFCSNNNWSDNDRVSANDLREMTIPASGSINVDAGRNGGVSVKGEDRSDILIRACVQAWGGSEEAAKAAAAAIKINTTGEIKADGPSGSDQHWSVSYQFLVPRRTNLNLTAHNGGISISGTDGTAEFETQNGGVNVTNVSGSVKGRTTNGGVNVSLSGTSFRGKGLDVQTTNGGVNLTIPENYAARVETGTVNGGFKSDIPALNVTTENIKGAEWGERTRTRRIETNLNGGGPLIRVITTNGGIKINSANADPIP
ncbi:hypothetical protein BH10ACI3_BH10ACI3_05180 [soil metagenome]